MPLTEVLLYSILVCKILNLQTLKLENGHFRKASPNNERKKKLCNFLSKEYKLFLIFKTIFQTDF